MQETILYVDATTHLPVKLETKGVKGTIGEGIHIVAREFSYEPIDEAKFSMTPPAGYFRDPPLIEVTEDSL